MVIFEPHAPIVGEEVFGLIRKGFAAPRKKLTHNLAGLKSRAELIEIFKKLGISENVRPGEIGLEKWDELYKAIYL